MVNRSVALWKLACGDVSWQMMQNGALFLQMAFWSSFVPPTHMSAAIICNYKQSTRWDLRNDHRDMSITDICNPLRSYFDLFSCASGALSSALLKLKYYILQIVKAPFLPSELLMVREDLAPLHIGLQQYINHENLRDKIHTSISSSDSEKPHVLTKIACAILPWVLSSTLSFTYHSMYLFAPSPFSSPSQQYLIHAPGRQGKTLVTNAIQCFLQLRNKNFITSELSAAAAQLLRGWWAVHSLFKVTIPTSEFNSGNILAKIQLTTEFQKVDLTTWDESRYMSMLLHL